MVLKTSFGDIEIELWSREAPKACRNFVQLCLEGYYDGVLFHRIVKGFIAQGGDPTGTGAGGESVYGHPFKVIYFIFNKSKVLVSYCSDLCHGSQNIYHLSVLIVICR